MRVYLDHCCYNRPFDDQTQLRVRLETEAKLAVQQQMRNGEIEYVWSDMLANEVEESPFWEQREWIEAWAPGACAFVPTTAAIEQAAEKFMRLGVKPADSIHLASAEAAECDCFLTVDGGILKKVNFAGRVIVANPLVYVQECLP